MNKIYDLNFEFGISTTVQTVIKVLNWSNLTQVLIYRYLQR